MRYADWGCAGPGQLRQLLGRGLHSSTFRLNLSTFRVKRWVHDFPQSIRQGDTWGGAKRLRLS